MTRLVRVFTVRDVPILVHWSVLAVSLFMLGAGVRQILTAAAGLASYLGVLVVHELGHQLVAMHRGYSVDRIETYPLHGICRLEEPEYPLDAAVIAWGGVLAQFAFAIPFVAYLYVFGYPRIGPLDVAFAIFGFLSPAIAILNLLPVAPLDGRVAWTYFFHRFRGPRHELRHDHKQSQESEKTALEAFEEALRKAKRQ